MKTERKRLNVWRTWRSWHHTRSVTGIVSLGRPEREFGPVFRPLGTVFRPLLSTPVLMPDNLNLQVYTITMAVMVYTITMAVMVYTITMADGAARVRFSGPLQTCSASGGPGFEAQFNNICIYLGFPAVIQPNGPCI